MERLSKALGNRSKHSPTIPAWGKAGLQSEGISLGLGVTEPQQLPLATALQSVLRVNPEAGGIKPSQTLRRAHSIGGGGGCVLSAVHKTQWLCTPFK